MNLDAEKGEDEKFEGMRWSGGRNDSGDEGFRGRQKMTMTHDSLLLDHDDIKSSDDATQVLTEEDEIIYDIESSEDAAQVSEEEDKVVIVCGRSGRSRKACE